VVLVDMGVNVVEIVNILDVVDLADVVDVVDLADVVDRVDIRRVQDPTSLTSYTTIGVLAQKQDRENLAILE
jgi:hypothetical protein